MRKAIMETFPDVEQVVFESDMKHVRLLRPDPRAGGLAWVRFRMGEDTQRVVMGEIEPTPGLLNLETP